MCFASEKYMSFERPGLECYGLNVCLLHNLCWCLIAIVIVLIGRAFERLLGHGGYDLTCRINTIIKG